MSNTEKYSVIVIMVLVAVGLIESYPWAALMCILIALVITFFKGE